MTRAKRVRNKSPGQTRSGTKKTKALKAEIRAAAQVIADNLEGRKMGRPPDYHPGFCHIAEQACIINATNPSLADMFGASDTAVDEWISRYPNFGGAIKRGRARTDDEVEAALIQRAKGYSHPAVKIFNEEGTALVVPYTEHYAPDTAAAFIWLKNRRPDRWRDQQPDKGAPPDETAALIRAKLKAIKEVGG